MKLLPFVGAIIGLTACSLAQDFPDAPKIWQDDGYKGQVYEDNPNYKGPREDPPGSLRARSDDNEEVIGANFPVNMPGQGQGQHTQVNTGTEDSKSCPAGFMCHNNSECPEFPGLRNLLTAKEFDDIHQKRLCGERQDSYCCKMEQDELTPREDQVPGEMTKPVNLSTSVNDFAQEFYSKYKESKSADSNLVFSPLSIHVALSMLASGATDGSATQMELFKVLGNYKNIRGLEREYKKLIDEYNFDDGITDRWGKTNSINDALELANRVWVTGEEKAKIKSSFKDLMRLHYFIDLEELPENDPADAVNDWVKEKTHDKIEKLFEDLSRDTKFLLTNVIYFHDAWTTEFYPLSEQEAKNDNLTFKLHNGVESTGQTKWMYRSSSHFNLRAVSFGEIETKVISIPTEHQYNIARRLGNRFDVVLVVPDKPADITKLDAYVSSTAGDFMDLINDAMAQEVSLHNDVSLQMPLFSLKGNVEVAKILKEMGVQGIFQKGDFSKLYDGEALKVGDIVHKATIDVDDKGVVAAAATGVELVALSAPVITGELTVDRPFMFIIRDTSRMVPLFMGKVMEPSRPE